MVIEYKDNSLIPTDFVYIRKTAGLSGIPECQAEQAIKNGLYSVVAYHENKAVGMGRLVGDGIMHWYIEDVAVLPEYQGQGIGTAIVEQLINYTERNSIPETKTIISLMAAKGKEAFYEKFGFYNRPSDVYGAGMTKKITIPKRTLSRQFDL